MNTEYLQRKRFSITENQIVHLQVSMFGQADSSDIALKLSYIHILESQ